MPMMGQTDENYARSERELVERNTFLEKKFLEIKEDLQRTAIDQSTGETLTVERYITRVKCWARVAEDARELLHARLMLMTSMTLGRIDPRQYDELTAAVQQVTIKLQLDVNELDDTYQGKQTSDTDAAAVSK